jgi:inosose dehydratase
VRQFVGAIVAVPGGIGQSVDNGFAVWRITRDDWLNAWRAKMSRFRIGCGQITWMNSGKSEDEILEEIAAAGYEGAPASAASLGDVDRVQEQFAEHGLAPAPGYVGAEFWIASKANEIVEQLDRQAEIANALGLTALYVAPNLTKKRRELAGHVSASDALSDAEYDTFADTLNRAGAAALRSGVSLCVHNHVGSYIETRAEMDELFSRVDRAKVFLGPDTGHLAWAGDEVPPFIQSHASDIRTIHLKDIDPDVRAQGVANSWNYADASDHGIFTELGQGLVNIPAVLDVLNSSGFDGWVIVETDVTQLPSAAESAKVSREYLRTLGY